MANELDITEFSDYAARFLAANPGVYHALDTLEIDFESDLGPIFERDTIEQVQSELRQYRHKVMCWVIYHDLKQWGFASAELSTIKTCKILSDFADACIVHALRYTKAKDLSVIGFGKLGGQELNFSSDVDLIFVGDLDVHRRCILKIVKLLSENTQDGFVFRVDLRLRPFGDSGPLVLNHDQTVKYYQEHGRGWERYAWVKARVICGSDKTFKALQGFIYRPYVDFTLLGELRSVKRKIDADAKKQGRHSHIKLGGGGIRELEFIVQSIQLIHGGKQKRLRCSGLLGAVSSAAKLGFVEEPKTLKAHYVFLRDLENKIQMLADRQTHELPESALLQNKIASAMQLTWSEVMDKLTDVRSQVSNHFNQLVFREFHDASLSEAALPEDMVYEDRYTAFLKVIEKRKPYLSLLEENTKLPNKLKSIFAKSERVFLTLKSHPFLLNVFLQKDPGFTRSALKETLFGRMADVDKDDIQTKLDVLREFKLETELQVMLQEIEEKLPLMKISDALTFTAEAILSSVLAEVKAQMGVDLDLGVCAYGKLGGLELSYTSDLDLVFLYQVGEQDLAVKVAQKILVWLQTRTYSGKLYEVDIRLRPDGASGLLVSKLDAFLDYQLHSAWLWEHQALLRTRMVAGSDSLIKAFEACRAQVLQLERAPDVVAAEVAKMREKICRAHLHDDLKNQLIDIEFEVQRIALTYAHQFPELVKFSDNVRILELAAECGVLDAASAQNMIKAYLALRAKLNKEFLS